MSALTAPYETFEKPGIVVSYLVANETVIYKGALVGVNTSGRIVPMNHATANLKFVGIANESIVAGTDKRLTVTKAGTFVMGATSPAANKIGSAAYAKTDNEVQDVTTSLTTSYTVGTIIGIETTSTSGSGYRIRIDNFTN